MQKVVQRRFRAPSSLIQKLLGILVAGCATQMFLLGSFVNVSKALFGIARISQPRNLGSWHTIGVWRVKPTTESLSVRTLSRGTGAQRVGVYLSGIDRSILMYVVPRRSDDPQRKYKCLGQSNHHLSSILQTIEHIVR
jgi:hypothetical protein